MTAVARRLAVLCHRNERERGVDTYLVRQLARFWAEDGIEVEYVFGVDRPVDADLLFVHVNLSVVPEEYLAFARRYPATVNARAADIRKRRVSRNLVQPGDGWDGPVIVKSNLNFGGQPERYMAQSRLQRRSRVWRSLTGRAAAFAGRGFWSHYVVLDRAAEVRDEWWARDDLVVERFLPELEGGLYHLRMYQFLGDRYTCTRLASTEPVIKAGNSRDVIEVEPPPQVDDWRRELGLDYGKIDYVVHEGEAVLIDANKTTAASRHLSEERLEELRRRIAAGIHGFFV